jgi:hypothetical protein
MGFGKFGNTVGWGAVANGGVSQLCGQQSWARVISRWRRDARSILAGWARPMIAHPSQCGVDSGQLRGTTEPS